MANNHSPSDNAGRNNNKKGVRKVNLSDIQGKLNKRGRERFHDPDLALALTEMLSDGEPFIWDTAVVSGKTDKALNASRAKWRSRAMSVFRTLNAPENVGISIQWTADNEMVVSLKEVND